MTDQLTPAALAAIEARLAAAEYQQSTWAQNYADDVPRLLADRRELVAEVKVKAARLDHLERCINVANYNIEQATKDRDAAEARATAAEEKIEAAHMAAAETHRTWGTRLHAIFAALDLNFGDPDEIDALISKDAEAALADARNAALEAAAVIVETETFSEIDLRKRAGPFTLQDDATKSATENAAAAIRKRIAAAKREPKP